MINYPHMYRDFDDNRLLELSKNILTTLNMFGEDDEASRVMAIKGMYCTEELKNRGYTDTTQDLIAEVAEELGLFEDART